MFIWDMKEIKELINSIQLNQGISFAELSRKLRVNSNILRCASDGKIDLKESKINALLNLSSLESLKIKKQAKY